MANKSIAFSIEILGEQRILNTLDAIKKQIKAELDADKY